MTSLIENCCFSPGSWIFRERSSTRRQADSSFGFLQTWSLSPVAGSLSKGWEEAYRIWLPVGRLTKSVVNVNYCEHLLAPEFDFACTCIFEVQSTPSNCLNAFLTDFTHSSLRLSEILQPQTSGLLEGMKDKAILSVVRELIPVVLAMYRSPPWLV